jgi:hypothetical protein
MNLSRAKRCRSRSLSESSCATIIFRVELKPGLLCKLEFLMCFPFLSAINANCILYKSFHSLFNQVSLVGLSCGLTRRFVRV